ncbi:MAG: FtsQ-type POTRA domain-containing protein [Succinatimonas sp.]|nr:FtsQ-type POTRA domain-containing protein [Succinatimonas sp.]
MKRQTRGHFIAGAIFALAVGTALWNFNSVLGTFLESGKSLPVKAVRIDGVLSHVSRRNVADTVGRLAGGQNIAAVDTEKIRQRLLEDPWTARVAVKRRMPDTLVISLVEHVPAAYWNNDGLYDAQNKTVFRPDLSTFDTPLVRLGAYRDNLSEEVYQSAVEFIKVLSHSNYHMVSLYLDQVRCYTLTLACGTKLILGRGREQASARLQRLLRSLPKSGIVLSEVSYVDLRYDVGFAVGPLKNTVLGEKNGVQSVSPE